MARERGSESENMREREITVANPLAIELGWAGLKYLWTHVLRHGGDRKFAIKSIFYEHTQIGCPLSLSLSFSLLAKTEGDFVAVNWIMRRIK